jgi:hypothetical protein
MKKILISLCLLTAFVSKAQLTTKVKQRFPAHILFKIDEVSKKIILTEEQQMQIGKRLTRKDSLANVYIHRTDTIIKLKDYYTIYKGMLKTIITPEQLDDYLSQMDKSNRFLLALKSAKELQLNTKQIEQIRLKNNILNTKLKFGNKQKNIFYAQKLDSILEKKQYRALLKIIYTQESALKTKKDWSTILKFKLTTPEDSASVYAKISNYNLIKNMMIDPKADIYGQKKKTAIRDKVNLEFQPAIITRYYILTEDLYKKNIFSESIKYEKQLNLTHVQIDTLLSNYKKIEQLKFNNETQNIEPDKSNSYASIENKAILKILDSKQLQLFLMVRNQKKALALATTNWKSLEKLGLTKDLNKEAVLKEFTAYQLSYLVANNKLKMDNSQINVFYRRDVLLTKPELLKQLDETSQNEETTKTTKNNLKW